MLIFVAFNSTAMKLQVSDYLNNIENYAAVKSG